MIWGGGGFIGVHSRSFTCTRRYTTNIHLRLHVHDVAAKTSSLFRIMANLGALPEVSDT